MCHRAVRPDGQRFDTHLAEIVAAVDQPMIKNIPFSANLFYAAMGRPRSVAAFEQQEELVHDYDVMLERCYRQPLRDGSWVSNAERNLEAMRALGFENTILSTDCGNPANPPREQAMGEYFQFMIDHGVPSKSLREMPQTLPARLLDLQI